MPQMAPLPWVMLYALVLAGLVMFFGVLNFSMMEKSGKVYSQPCRPSSGWVW
uniref:ATP synthase F0 subunit 8 n=1 Tax=Sphaeroma terebrans TaxID=180402 RepID=A0A5J6NKW7_SPHTE|nr:ATP synthase F0 subunit 8 [Sphaeroma terebrans]